jgi:hypothetical protein
MHVCVQAYIQVCIDVCIRVCMRVLSHLDHITLEHRVLRVSYTHTLCVTTAPRRAQMRLLAHVPKSNPTTTTTTTTTTLVPFPLDRSSPAPSDVTWTDETAAAAESAYEEPRCQVDGEVTLLRDREECAAYACAVLEGAGRVSSRFVSCTHQFSTPVLSSHHAPSNSPHLCSLPTMHPATHHTFALFPPCTQQFTTPVLSSHHAPSNSPNVCSPCVQLPYPH